MKKLNTSVLVSGLVLAALSGNTFGDAGISFSTTNGVNPANISAKVNFKITIPKIMILRVGDWGPKDNTVVWTHAFGITPLTPDRDAIEDDWTKTGTAVTSLTATDDDAVDTTDGSLAVAAFGNTGGDLKLAAVVTDFVAIGAGTAPSVANDISVAVTGGVPHPGFDVVAGADLKNASGIVRETGTWKYTYTPSSVAPVGGEYTASVLYTLSAM